MARLVATFGWRIFGLREHREVSAWLLRGGVAHPAARLVGRFWRLRRRRPLSGLSLDRLASAVRHRARREAYRALTVNLSPVQRARLVQGFGSPRLPLEHLGEQRQPNRDHPAFLGQPLDRFDPGIRAVRRSSLWDRPAASRSHVRRQSEPCGRAGGPQMTTASSDPGFGPSPTTAMKRYKAIEMIFLD